MYSLPRVIPAINVFPSRNNFLGQAAPVVPAAAAPAAPPMPAAPGTGSATLAEIRKLAEQIRDNRALLAEAFQKFVQTGDPSWNTKSDEYDKKVLQLVQQAQVKAVTLSAAEQPIAADLIAGNFKPKMGYRYLGQGTPTPATTPAAATPTAPAAPAAPAPVAPAAPAAPAPVAPAATPPVQAPAPAPAPGVVCRTTAEGGQVCSNGTCTAPGAVAPVTAAEAPSTFPYIPVAIGVGATALVGTIWYLIARK